VISLDWMIVSYLHNPRHSEKLDAVTPRETTARLNQMCASPDGMIAHVHSPSIGTTLVTCV
jgi:hypothetical protein